MENLRLTQDAVSFVLEPQTWLPKEEKSGLPHATQDKNDRVLLTPHRCYRCYISVVLTPMGPASVTCSPTRRIEQEVRRREGLSSD